MIFETHSHYTSRRFKDHLHELLQSLPQQNVKYVVDCATDFDNAQECIKLAKKYNYIYAAVGIHPESLIEKHASTVYKYKGDWQKELRDIETLLSEPKVVAVGECGLDYHWPVPKQEQYDMFEAHLELAKKHAMPIIIHDREAHAPMYELLKKHKPHGILHCYSGSVQDAKWLVDQGVFIGVGGVVTFKNSKKLQECVEFLPLENLVLETDCPYLAPEPHRGKECNSAMIIHIAEKIAEIKKVSTEKVLETTMITAKNIFGISG